MNISKIKEQALKYLGYQGQSIDIQTEKLINECLDEINHIAHFKVVYQRYPLNHHPLRLHHISLEYDDLITLFQDCHEVIVIGCTLGVAFERTMKKLYLINMTKATIMDAIGSSYLEACCDEYEKTIIKEKRTFRFCPGYGHVPLSLNRELAQLLDCSKHIGLTIQNNDLLLPQKSMIGIIGLGQDKTKKSCQHCKQIEHCQFRKRGQRCYKTN